MKILSILLLTISLGYSQEFIPIKAGDPSPIDGFVISKPTEKMLRQTVENLEFKNLKLTDLSVKQENMIKVQDSHINLQRKHNKDLRTELSQRTGFWSKAVYFALGSLVTTGIAYINIKTLR